MRYDVLLMNFRNVSKYEDTISCVFILTNSLNKNNYLNFAKTKPSVSQSRVSDRIGWVKIRERRASKQGSQMLQVAETLTWVRQAVRSLGPLRCSCYQASTRGLSTSSSRWDLDWLRKSSGKTPLGCGFALRCFQRFSLLDVAIQLWPRQANWLTSGPAISVLSYWR
jgi:hypothetical protein